MTVTKSVVETPRLATHVRQAGESGAPPFVLVHGNVSSGVFFEDLMERLASTHHVVAPDFRGYGGSERKAIDAARGVRDFSDDLAALIDTMDLGSEPIPLLGWSAGSGVVMQYALDHNERVSRLILESGMSPYGFGGTKGVEGTPVWDDFAGSGGGTVNPDFLRLLGEGDRGTHSPVAPLNTMRSFYVKAGFEYDPAMEDAYLDGMLETKTGDDIYPGDLVTSENWPGVAPGLKGMNNALSPKYFDLSSFADLTPAVPVLWVRGDSDQIVSDTSFFDFGYLGQLGLVPGWPGDEVYPPQPMVAQLRSLLDRAGNYTELVYDDCGHTPHIEHPERFATDLGDFLSR